MNSRQPGVACRERSVKAGLMVHVEKGHRTLYISGFPSMFSPGTRRSNCQPFDIDTRSLRGRGYWKGIGPGGDETCNHRQGEAVEAAADRDIEARGRPIISLLPALTGSERAENRAIGNNSGFDEYPLSIE